MTNKKYTYEEVFEASKEYFNGDELAAKVFVDKYALQNKQGEYLELTPTDMHWRLAKEFARIEQKYPNPMSEQEIFDLLDKFKYVIPQGSPMSGIGNDDQIMSISNCFVLDAPEDSYAGIMHTDQQQVHLMRRRGGVGFDISKIRPAGMPTANAAKTTDGISVFMERFSNTCREVATRSRRGALMLTISVHHPEIKTFINIKKDLKKVTGANISIRTTDEFMNAVKNNSTYEQKWPVDSNDPQISQMVNAKEIWDEMIEAVHTSAEPGILFWDTVQKNSPADIYKDFGYNSQSTNPCISGDTLIATADGRNAVTIKQLAEEGRDVAVYSSDPQTGKVSIKQGRNPRITGYNQKLLRITLDDDSHIDVTPNHTFYLLDGSKIEAKDLKSGYSLPRFVKDLQAVKKGSKDYYLVHCNTNDHSVDNLYEHRLIAKYNQPDKWNEVYNRTKSNGFVKTGGLVVHHIDYDQLNNAPDNLAIMTFREHSKLHGEIDQAGEKNGRYCGVTNEQLKEKALEFTKSLGRRSSRKEWQAFAIENGLPQAFTQFREKEFGTITEFLYECAKELGYEHLDVDPRTVKIYHSMIDQGYDAKIVDKTVFVSRTCEGCDTKFEVEHAFREQSYCTSDCHLNSMNFDTEFREYQKAAVSNWHAERMSKIKIEQARVYSQLKFDIRRDPQMSEWENACKAARLPYRVGKKLKYGYKNFKEVAKAGKEYNHKVSRIEELPGEHTVYNITVDDNHTFAVVTRTHEKRKNLSYHGVIIGNCGEVPISKFDSCRLTVMNLNSYVTDPFTSNSSFDFDLYSKHVIKAQRLMDDIVDLELECIDKIIKKIKSDKESNDIKRIELDLWDNVKKACMNGRRTGLGITAIGDALASLGIKYGSDESIEMTEKIYKTLEVSAYKSTCIMAKERGAFPIYDYELEKDHKFIGKVVKQDKELYDLYKKHGRRNIALTTTAPTGSVSIMTQTSSGIEPIFMLSYKRRKKINPSDKNAKVDFIDDMGDKWQEFVVYHHGVKKWMDITGETDITKSPYWGATASEIDWVAGVKLQAAAQSWICHSLSRTANLPNTATKELISDVYMKAWESGCKGYTVYRDGCRSGVLVSNNEPNKDSSGRPKEIQSVMAPKRPEKLPCEIHYAKIKGKNWVVLVGLLDGKPYEMFAGESEAISLPSKCTTGSLQKSAKGKYNLHVTIGDEEMVIKDVVKVFDNSENSWATRLVSMSMRHGVPLDMVIDQLNKDGDVFAVNKILGRILKKYIAEGSKVRVSAKCPECSSTELYYIEGCMTCKNCSWSKCN